MTTRSPAADRREVLRTAIALVDRARDEGVQLRALGGVAIALTCPSASTQPLSRQYSDIDLAVPGRSVARATQLIERAGFAPAREFNAVHGRRRQMFDQAGLHLDLFVDRFVMCHEISFSWSGGADRQTIDSTELLLTKLQVVHMTAKDIADVAALVLDHELGGDVTEINHLRMARLFAHDWGWWRTGSGSLAAAVGALPALLREPRRLERALRQLALLQRAIDAEPKSLRWRVRDRIGERMPWFEEPETAGPE